MTIQTTEPAAALATAGIAPALPEIEATATTVELVKWVQEAQAAAAIADMVYRSSMVPDALTKGKTPEQIKADVTTVIMAGAEVGLKPNQSLQNIFPVYGKPAMYARTMVSLVQRLGHSVNIIESTPTQVTVEGVRKGEADGTTFTWNIDRAKTAGYTSNKKYQTNPQEMLYAKAAAECCRVMFADVLLGMPYSVEDGELEDLGERATAPQPRQSSALAAQRERAAQARQAQPAPQVNTDTGELVTAEEFDWRAAFEAEDKNDASALRLLYTRARAAGADEQLLQDIAAAGTIAANTFGGAAASTFGG